MSRILSHVLPCTAILLMTGCNTRADKALAVASGVNFIPPDSMTVTSMRLIGNQISEFVAERGYVPASVYELPALRNNGDLTKLDGWGRQFNLTYEGDLISLTSYGADGRAGGLNEDADFVATMRVKGRDIEWVTEPADHPRSDVTQLEPD